jgi:hypothetical protein
MEAFIRGLYVEKLTEFIQTQLRPLNNGFIFNHGNLRRGSQFFNPATKSKKPRRSEVFSAFLRLVTASTLYYVNAKSIRVRGSSRNFSHGFS